MSDLLKTLKSKNDNTINIYPNVKSENIPDSAITNSKIQDNSISTSKIQDSAITTSKIQDNVISTSKVQDASITTNKINDNAISNSKIQDSSISTSKIQDASITTNKLSNNSITNNKIGDGEITFGKLSFGLFHCVYQFNFSTYNIICQVEYYSRHAYNISENKGDIWDDLMSRYIDGQVICIATGGSTLSTLDSLYGTKNTSGADTYIEFLEGGESFDVGFSDLTSISGKATSVFD